MGVLHRTWESTCKIYSPQNTGTFLFKCLIWPFWTIALAWENHGRSFTVNAHHKENYLSKHLGCPPSLQTGFNFLFGRNVITSKLTVSIAVSIPPTTQASKSFSVFQQTHSSFASHSSLTSPATKYPHLDNILAYQSWWNFEGHA